MRKVCIVVASRANYGRVKYLMKAVAEHPDLELQLIVSASTLLYRFGNAIDVIRADGFEPARRLHYILEGETLVTQAKSTGMGIIELSTAFDDLNPDMVVTVADRFETMSTAIAASYMNIPLVHLQGGEVSGNIDDRVRHAVTKLASIHFPSTELARERIIKMGEDPDFVFNFGCPAMDILATEELSLSLIGQYGGVGHHIDWSRPYLLLSQHPVTTSYGDGLRQITETLEACAATQLQTIVLWPNADAGTDDVSKGIRMFRERHSSLPFYYLRNFSPEDYARVLSGAACLVGNSSSFIREGAFLGTPAVLVGDRQEGREHGTNLHYVGYDKIAIQDALSHQFAHGRYEPDYRFGQGNAGNRIADKLANVKIENKKKHMF